MTGFQTPTNSKHIGHLVQPLLLVTILALVIAVVASVAVRSSDAATTTLAPAEAATEVSQPEATLTRSATRSDASLPPAPPEVAAGEEADDPSDPWIRPGIVECPPGTIEHDGQCLEFEVPDCPQGFVLIGLECVPQFEIVPDLPVIEAPDLPQAPVPTPIPAEPVPTPLPTPGPVITPVPVDIAPICAEGEILVDGLCVPTVAEPIVCPDGKVFIDGGCVEPLPFTPTEPAPAGCPDGTVWNPHANTCVPNPCEEHETFVDGYCISYTTDDDEPAHKGCPDGTVWNPHANTCVPNPCEEHETFVDGDCVPDLLIDTPPIAPAGCPEGTVWNPHANTCVPNPCEEHEIFVIDRCVEPLIIATP